MRIANRSVLRQASLREMRWEHSVLRRDIPTSTQMTFGLSTGTGYDTEKWLQPAIFTLYLYIKLTGTTELQMH